MSRLSLIISSTLLAGVLVGTIACTARSQPGPVPPPFRQIAIPSPDNGYDRFSTMIIDSQKELDSFLEPWTGAGWRARGEFADALRAASVDFDRQALVLVRHTERSGSVPVTLSPPVLAGRTLIIEVHRRPVTIGTADMAYYCYAFAVSRQQVQRVEMRVFSGSKETSLAPLTLNPEQAAAQGGAKHAQQQTATTV